MVDWPGPESALQSALLSAPKFEGTVTLSSERGSEMPPMAVQAAHVAAVDMVAAAAMPPGVLAERGCSRSSTGGGGATAVALMAAAACDCCHGSGETSGGATRCPLG